MQALIEAIRSQGRGIGSEIVKVDSFLNHRLDTGLLFEMGEAFAQRYAGDKPDLVLTVEASGIALALATAHALGDIPVVLPKKPPQPIKAATWRRKKSTVSPMGTNATSGWTCATSQQAPRC